MQRAHFAKPTHRLGDSVSGARCPLDSLWRHCVDRVGCAAKQDVFYSRKRLG